MNTNAETLQRALAARCYSMSESHLSGYRIIIGFNTLPEMQAAADAIATTSNWLQSADGKETVRALAAADSVSPDMADKKPRTKMDIFELFEALGKENEELRAALAAHDQPASPGQEEWSRALNCAASQFEGYVRRNELATAEQRMAALDDAMQHAFGLLSLRTAQKET